MARVSKLKPFDKYEYYVKAVQSPDVDVRFYRKIYRDLRAQEPMSLREDFCGTLAIGCEWVKLNKSYQAFGIDRDPEPLAWGHKNHLLKLTSQQRARVTAHCASVLDRNLPHADLIVAVNFSYCLFKSRKVLIQYLANARKTLNRGGVLILDIFGGGETQMPNVETVSHRGFKYYWDQTDYDPITSEARFFIHFRRKGELKRKRVFQYDWRLWSISEIRDGLKEAGFKDSHVYWEGTTRNGRGDNVFRRRRRGDASASWIAYIVAEK